MKTENIGPDHEQRPAALTALTLAFPDWEAWDGELAGLLYARHCDPQIVVRSTSTEGLREEIERAERERGLR